MERQERRERRERQVFTDAYIAGLKPSTRPYKRSEHAPKGDGRLIVRVQPSGTKEAFYRYRANGLDRTVSLGRYNGKGQNGKTLRELRATAKKYRRLQDETGDVKEHLRAERRRREVEARQGSFGQLLDAYVDTLKAAGKPSAAQAKAVFRRYIRQPFPGLVTARASEIEPADVQRILARMVKAGIKRQVNITRSYLHAAFAFGGKVDHDPRTVAHDGVLFALKSNPITLVPRIADYEKAGDRVLTTDELREFWKALDWRKEDTAKPAKGKKAGAEKKAKERPLVPLVTRAFLRFNLALGGQRVTQLLRVDWPAFDFEANTVLLRDTKGRGGARDHLVPLTPFALEQLQPLREINGHPDEDGHTPPPFSAHGQRRMVLETLSVAVREISKTLKKSKKVPTFQLRDLRRTCETMLAEIGISKEIRAHLLSHGRDSGVQAKHYDRYSYLPEKRAALERWAERLQRILDPSRKGKLITGSFGRAA